MVIYDNNKNFSELSDIQLNNVLPGDTITYSVQYKNDSGEETTFYLNADIVQKSLEESANQGGAYSFKLTNNGEILFDSATVGGDVTSEDNPLGLEQIPGKDGAYFSRWRLTNNGVGTVELSITLDGNSLTNSYEDALGQLKIQFAAEPTASAEISKTDKRTLVQTITKLVKLPEKTTQTISIDDTQVPLVTGNPKTGDSMVAMAIFSTMFIIGMCLVLWYVANTINNKNKEVNPDEES